MYKVLQYIILLISLFIFYISNAQYSQTALNNYLNTSFATYSSLRPSPKAIMIRSAIIPGLGQISNRQIWKVPLFYSGFAASVYFLSFSRASYLDFRQAFIYRTDGDPNTIDVYDPVHGTASDRYNETQLKFYRDQNRRNMELAVIITAGIYAFNVLDAFVSAHLRDFDISEDLSISLNIPSVFVYNNNTFFNTGITLKF